MFKTLAVSKGTMMSHHNTREAQTKWCQKNYQQHEFLITFEDDLPTSLWTQKGDKYLTFHNHVAPSSRY